MKFPKQLCFWGFSKNYRAIKDTRIKIFITMEQRTGDILQAAENLTFLWLFEIHCVHRNEERNLVIASRRSRDCWTSFARGKREFALLIPMSTKIIREPVVSSYLKRQKFTRLQYSKEPFFLCVSVSLRSTFVDGIDDFTGNTNEPSRDTGYG